MKKPTLFLVAVVLSAGLVAASATQASAYNLTGAHWPSANRPVTISQTYSGTANGWLNGMAAWFATSTPAYFHQEAGNQTTILSDVSNSSVGWDGMATWYPGTGTITNAAGQLNYYYTQNYGTNKLKGLAAHELGHILGLAHHNGCYLMVDNTPQRTSCGIYTPQSDDQAGVNALY